MTGHVGNWELGAVTLRRHGLTPAVVGQPELDPNVQEMRRELRDASGGRVHRHRHVHGRPLSKFVRPIESGRAVALLVDRAYPEDQVLVPFFGRPTPVSAVPGAARPVLRLRRSCPAFSCAAGTAATSTSGANRFSRDRSRSRPEEDALADHGRVARELEGVIRAHPTQWFNFYRFWGDHRTAAETA